MNIAACFKIKFTTMSFCYKYLTFRKYSIKVSLLPWQRTAKITSKTFILENKNYEQAAPEGINAHEQFIRNKHGNHHELIPFRKQAGLSTSSQKFNLQPRLTRATTTQKVAYDNIYQQNVKFQPRFNSPCVVI